MDGVASSAGCFVASKENNDDNDDEVGANINAVEDVVVPCPCPRSLPNFVGGSFTDHGCYLRVLNKEHQPCMVDSHSLLGKHGVYILNESTGSLVMWSSYCVN
jgi:hypothetical protein